MAELRYYLIRDRLVGKEAKGAYYLFREGAWEPDVKNVIMDRLVGYDPFEPPGSPYGIGCMSVMDEIEEISEEEALKRTGGKG